jgi:hypothetical protein
MAVLYDINWEHTGHIMSSVVHLMHVFYAALALGADDSCLP